MNNKESEDYSDIIHLPHHVSHNHPQMTMMARAAQFAPFSALTGFNSVIHETARLTDHEIILEDDANYRLNTVLSTLMERLEEHPTISVSYFMPDEQKSGGKYASVTGQLKRINDFEQVMIMVDGTTIPLAHVMDIQY